MFVQSSNKAYHEAMAELKKAENKREREDGEISDDEQPVKRVRVAEDAGFQQHVVTQLADIRSDINQLKMALERGERWAQRAVAGAPPS